MIECATIVSSLGTLAMAICSLYQLRRSQRDSFLPILSLDDVERASSGVYRLQVRNYGTGPALNVRIQIHIHEKPLQAVTSFQGHRFHVCHVATNEVKEILLSTTTPLSNEMKLNIDYECIRHRHFASDIPLHDFVPLENEESIH